MVDDQLSARHIAAIHEMYELRGQVTTSYAQVEFFLADVGQKASALPEYDHLNDLWAHRLSGRLAAFIRLLERPGPLRRYAERGREIVERFPQFEEPRHFLVHGLTTFELEPDGADWTAIIWRYEVVGGAPELRMWRANKRRLAQFGGDIGALAQEFVSFCRDMYVAEELELPPS